MTSPATVAPRRSGLRRRRIRGNGSRTAAVISTAVVVTGGLGMVLPFIYMIATSFRPSKHALDLPPVWLATPRWENYHNALTGPVPLLASMLHSFLVAGAVTIGQLIICPAAGYAFARMRFRGRSFLFSMLLASLMVPIQVTIVPLFLLMSKLGLINNLWSLILPSLSGALGIFLLRQFFSTLPQELFDAARVDGAGPVRTYVSVALPLVKPALTTLGIITFLASWNSYFAPLIFLSDIRHTTLPPALVVMLGPYHSGDLAMIMAATTIAIVPCLVVFLVGQRWIVESLSRSGVKG
jgi:multiple sugar transport system permease protein